MSSSKFVVDAETAAADFERFCEYARVDFDEPRDENETKDLNLTVEKFVYFIRKGHITVDEKGRPAVRLIYSDLPNGPEELSFQRTPRGSMLRAADRVKKNQENGKMIAMMVESTGVPIMLFDKMEWDDVKIALLVFGFFLD